MSFFASLHWPPSAPIEFSPLILSVGLSDSTPTASLFPVLPVKHMMYGFGDVQEPDKETVDLVEDMTLDYVTNFAHRCMEERSRGKLQTEDLLYLHSQRRKEGAARERATRHEHAAQGSEEEFQHGRGGIDPAK